MILPGSTSCKLAHMHYKDSVSGAPMGHRLMDPSLISSGVVSQNVKGKEQLIQGQTDEEGCDAE